MVCFRLGSESLSAYELDGGGNLVSDKLEVTENRLVAGSLNVDDLESRMVSDTALALDLTGRYGAMFVGDVGGFCLR